MTVAERETGLRVTNPSEPTFIGRATLAAKDTTRIY